jgi:hypothetical protein
VSKKWKREGWKSKDEMQTCIDQLTTDCNQWAAEVRELRRRLALLQQVLDGEVM